MSLGQRYVGLDDSVISGDLYPSVSVLHAIKNHTAKAHNTTKNTSYCFAGNKLVEKFLPE